MRKYGDALPREGGCPVTVHVVATHLETSKEYEAVVEEGSYCIVSHGTQALPDPAQLRSLGTPVTLRLKATAS